MVGTGNLSSKIEKVPRGIQVDKSGKYRASSKTGLNN